MGVIGRLVRATVLEILSQEFVGALAAKGLTRWPVIRHVCKNAAPPVLALMGLQFGYLLGGSILVETVFNWPGSGNLLNLAIFRRDIPVLQATILVLARSSSCSTCWSTSPRRRSIRGSDAERTPCRQATDRSRSDANSDADRSAAGRGGARLLEGGRTAPAARSGHDRGHAGPAAASSSSRLARRWSPAAILMPAACWRG